MTFNAVVKMRVGPSEPSVQKQASNYASAAVLQKSMVVSDWRKVGRKAGKCELRR